MGAYLIRRLLLLPLTLFCIVFINFIIINLAPGDPVSITEISQQGATRSADRSFAFGNDDRYLLFRERYGLTLPIVFNTWPWITRKETEETLKTLIDFLAGKLPQMSFSDYDALRVKMGDQSKFVMRHLVSLLNDPTSSLDMQAMAAGFIIRGGASLAILGTYLTEEEKEHNRKIAEEMEFLSKQRFFLGDQPKEIQEKKKELTEWYLNQKNTFYYHPNLSQKMTIFFFETRFFKYMKRVLTLDFGSMRNDENKTVISEVVKRFKYSLTLSVLPMLATFFLCQIFGFIMALSQGTWKDHGLNFILLVFYAIPVFVVGPFLIEKLALHHTFFWTDVPVPISGFTSPDLIYDQMSSWQRFWDIMQHIALPLTAIMYGSVAAQSRISRTAVVEVMRQDYVRTARAKGVPFLSLWIKHIGRNASITIVTSIAGSLGVILGGSLIVETLFQIDGFGKFFYDAVINRDYNVIMFSALAGSFLTLFGYLLADIAYTLLDPRVNLER